MYFCEEQMNMKANEIWKIARKTNFWLSVARIALQQ